jgi:hypothetical protein
MTTAIAEIRDYIEHNQSQFTVAGRMCFVEVVDRLEKAEAKGDVDAWNAAMEQIGKLQADNQRLRDALARFGIHDDDCDVGVDESDTGAPQECTCGLVEIFK